MVVAVWRDSTQYMLEWMDPLEAAKLEMATIETVGIMVVLDDEKLVLASDRDGHEQLKNFTVIPRNCLVSVDPLQDDEGSSIL
jgi:hypothetical protein